MPVRTGVPGELGALISFHGTFSYCENKRKRHNETRGAIWSCMKLDGFRMSVFPSVLTVRVRPASSSRYVFFSVLTVRVRPASSCVSVFLTVLTVRLRPVSFSLSGSPSDLTVRLRAARNTLNSSTNFLATSTGILQRVQRRVQQQVQQRVTGK